MSTKQIPILDLKGDIEAHWQEYTDAIAKVMRSTHFIGGPEVGEFEQKFAQYLGVKHAVGVNSGTDALVIALRALGIKAGDEVIVPSFSFFATAECVGIVGATPVFVDIDPDTYNLDPKAFAAAITKATKAVIPVHLFGHAADLDPILEVAKKHGIKVLEDNAQATSGDYKGKKLGTIGDAGAFSFFPSKNLGAFGDAGLLATNDDGIAEQARMLRAHGGRKKYHNEILGYNSRLDTIQAAILLVKLKYLDEATEGRRKAAAVYNELLKGEKGIVLPVEKDYAKHVYHQYTIRVLDGKRDEVQKKLENVGIGTMVYYPVPMHKLPVYSGLKVELVRSEEAAGEVLSLPIWPGIERGVQERVVGEVSLALQTF